MATRRALFRTVPALYVRTALPRPKLQAFKMAPSTDIARRRLHATATHLQTATTTVASGVVEYPTSHQQIAEPTDTHNFIDNKFVPSKSSTWIDLHDPATNNL